MGGLRRKGGFVYCSCSVGLCMVFACAFLFSFFLSSYITEGTVGREIEG